ncbi:ABC transporter C family member 3 [Talaromyces islandicus]|uniref:ABC transporter C family member 3 n=1 Tax=Talaromyces islandicus TaxID=28573 RepID=A0A0U1M6S7_TALIS|nr:ABC transporter C family member 3 [Talaromyces islandicus]
MASLLQCDAAFGPRVNPSCRAFDFTLLFEDILLTILPNVVFILLLPVLVYNLFRTPNVARKSGLLAVKTLLLLCLTACQAAFLTLRRLDPGVETRASLAADILSLVGAIGAGLISWFHHCGSVHPSTLLSVFFGVSFILDIVRVRTLWLLHDESHPAVVLTLALALKLGGLVLESLSKRKSLYLSGKEEYTTSGPEPFTGFWIRVGFAWLFPTMRQGYHQILSVGDLPALDYRMRSDRLSYALQNAMVKYDLKWRYSLLQACFRAYRQSLLAAVIPRLCLTGFTFVQPFLINALILYIDENAPASNGKAMIGAYALVYLGIAISNSVYSYHTFRFLTQLRGGLVSIIYQENLQCRKTDRGDIDGLTLMGTDVERIIAGFRSIHELWASLVDIGIATYLLQRQVYVACLVPSILVFVFVLVTFQIAAWSNKYQKSWIEKVEERLSVTSSIVGDMKAIKMLGLGDKLFNIIDKLRQAEITESIKFRRLIISQIFFSNSPSVMAPVATFAVFVAIAAVPWFINGTIRDNITGQSATGSVDEEWYSSVLWACGLETDFCGFREGDKTIVGSKGSFLSGGQKQRIALARAVYSRCQLILLDDVFSGVDAYNVSLISNRLLGKDGLLRKTQATVVFVTHTPSVLAVADVVIMLENGHVVEFGTREELQKENRYVSTLESLSGVSEEASLLETASNLTNNHGSLAIDAPSSSNEQATDLSRRSGDFSVYRYFSKASGHMAIAGVFAFLILCVFCAEFSTVWVDWWSSASTESSSSRVDGMYLGVYATLGVASTLCMTIACWFLFIIAISNSAKNLHTDLLKTTLGATLQYFLETDVGSIINRFSQDMELVGMDLCSVAINYSYALCGVIGKGILLAVFGKYLTAALPLVVLSVYIIQKFYLRTSRQVRLLDIEAKAPLYQLFLETSDGGSTVRAFGWQRSFQQILESRLDASQRPVYSLYCIQQLLAFVLDLLVTALAVILVGIVVTWKEFFYAGGVGVALVTVMSFNRALMSLVKYWTTLETSIGAVARIKAFVEETPLEDYSRNHRTDIAPNWPASGMVEFTNVVATYKPETDPILKGISLSIKPREKIAICGRSGSGKTSLILCLLGMINFQDTGSIRIDSVDISSLARGELRSRINVVPQDPFLMPGTVRFNIDPYEKVSDDIIIATLQKLNVWDKVESIGGLNAQRPLTSWSVGEKQLLCLARAMVRKSCILILDEATSSVDLSTEGIMHDAIEKDFAGQTVLAVVHRLGYIKRFDKVAFLQDGKLIEYDSPDALLKRDSAFATLYKSVSH